MSDKHLEVSEEIHKELKKLSERKKTPIKYLVEEAIKALLKSNKDKA